MVGMKALRYCYIKVYKKKYIIQTNGIIFLNTLWNWFYNLDFIFPPGYSKKKEKKRIVLSFQLYYLLILWEYKRDSTIEKQYSL